MKVLKRFGRNLAFDFRHNKALLVMILPIAVYLIIFHFAMCGIVIAFKQYNFAQGIFGSPWCGWNNFRFFFMSGKRGR
jgi:putative aldouronate transport system permease protein